MMTDKNKKPSKKPKPNGSNGRDSKGRFVNGNPGGPGNPFGSQIEKLRAALYKAVTDEDIEAIVKKMIVKAKAGDTHAAQFLFDRIFGKAMPAEGSGTEDDPIHVELKSRMSDEEFTEVAKRTAERIGERK